MPKLTILDRYIFRECFTSFLMATGVLTTIMFIGSAFRLLNDAKGLDMVDVLRVAPLILPYVVMHILPFSVLIGTLSGYTRLSSDREMTAMKLAGVPAGRLAAPALFLGLSLSLVSLYTSNYVTPFARRELSGFIKTTVTKLISRLSESRNSFEYSDPRSTWKFHWKGVRDGRLRDLIVYRSPRSDPKRAETPAASAEILYAASGAFRLDPYDNLIKFELEDLLGYYDLAADAADSAGAPGPAGDGSPERVLRSGDRNRKLRLRGGTFAVTVDFGAADAEEDLRTRAGYRDLQNLMALRARALPDKRVSPRTIDIEVHRRLSLALSACTLALLGAALGLIFRGANRILAYLLGFVVGPVVYFPLTRIGESAAESGGASPAITLQLGNLALLVIALILFRRGGR